VVSLQDNEDPVVFTLTETLTRRSAKRVTDIVRLLPRQRTVVVDVTAIPGFDSEGVTELMELRDNDRGGRIAIVGMREAAARLVGVSDLAVETAIGDEATGYSRIRRMAGVALVTVDAAASAASMREALTAAVADDAAIVIVDLAKLPHVDAAMVDALAFASTQVLMAGQEMVLLNVADDAGRRLRHAALAATTYIAPIP